MRKELGYTRRNYMIKDNEKEHLLRHGLNQKLYFSEIEKNWLESPIV